MKVALVFGARPQIIKSAPVIREALKCSEIDLHIIHTGQHYDYEMSKVFFDELELPDASVNLGVESGSHGWQTGTMLIKIEKVLIKYKPDVVLVPGDTNSTLAGALAAAKLNVPVGHVEAGARSYDMSMPEEVNRKLTDHCSKIMFAPTENCKDNLLREGILKERVFMVGDTMYDVLLQHLPAAMESDVLDRLELKPEKYALLTVHRPRNVDEQEKLRNIVEALEELREVEIVFPIHPRARKNLERFKLERRLVKSRHIKIMKPVSYHDNLKLMRHAAVVLTDSGGMQKEAFWLGTPCITLRDRTEWVETIKLGANVLVGNNKEKIVEETRKCLVVGRVRDKKVNPFGDGNASKKIVETLRQLTF